MTRTHLQGTVMHADERAEFLHGDALRVLQAMDDNVADLILADPPYSSGGQFRGDRTQGTGTKYVSSDSSRRQIEDFTGDTRDQRGYLAWSLWLTEAYRVLKPGRGSVVFTDWRQLPITTDALQAAGFVWRGIITWDKVSGRNNPGICNGRTEFAVWGTKGPTDLGPDPAFLPPVLRFPIKRDERELHQTPKPVELLAELCKLAPLGGLVVDPFAGSGSVGVAALRAGRVSRSIELSPVHAATAAERVARAAAQGDLFGEASR